MTDQIPPDAELLDRFRAGDDDALGALFARYEAPVFRFLFGLLKDHHKAEDALQETFVQALRTSENVDPSRFRGWLFTVAHQQAMLLIRRTRKVPGSACDEALQAIADLTPSPELIVEREADRETVRELLAMLPDGQQAVIRLRVFDGLRFREVADRLGCPLNTALARMHDGLKKLRELWEGRNHA